jgi:hypothetical protein
LKQYLIYILQKTLYWDCIDPLLVPCPKNSAHSLKTMQLSVLNGTTVAPRSREVASFASKNRSKKIHPQRGPALETRSRSLAVGKVTRSTNVLCSAASATGAPTGTSGSVDENSVLDAVIVGAGISGLTTALVRFLSRR